MKRFKILLYEDDVNWKNAFNYNLLPRLQSSGIELKILHKLDGSTVMQDIEWLPNLIMVDYDLGEETGEDVIKQIENDPDFTSTSIFFYSGGESIESLIKIARNFRCNISCYTKDGSELEEAVLAKAAKAAI